MNSLTATDYRRILTAVRGYGHNPAWRGTIDKVEQIVDASAKTPRLQPYPLCSAAPDVEFGQFGRSDARTGQRWRM